jgi:hypothetical protein
LAPAEDRFAVGLRAADERLAPAVDDFARVLVARLAVGRFAVLRFAAGLRALALRPLLAVPVLLPLELSIGFHLPDMTRCAASATASAISEPSLVALETTLLAARSAVSAASRPASRIFLRAAGLALIAAAAAARPAASISLLIAAFASLSTVALPLPERDEDFEPDFEEVEREEVLRADLAFA